MKRVLLKLSGEALAGEKKTGFDEATVIEVAKQIRTIAEEGLEIGIVIGGGNFWRGRTSETIDRNKADQNNNSGNGTGDSSDDPGNGGNSDDPGTNDDPGSNDDPGNGGDMISTAEQYIGQSLDALEGACGSPQGSSYEDDPETGKTGFHYYSNFTVSTTVDENGNEIVAGIW